MIKLGPLLAGWFAVAVISAALVFQTQQHSTTITDTIGGPFTLTSHEGRRVSSVDFRGKPFLILFGFTNCPEICPTTLLDLTNTIAALGPTADRMNYLFVTVDPERDTPRVLARYLSSFDKRIIGLTGTAQEIADVAKRYRVFYERVPTSDGYTMNHSTLWALMDHDGRFAGTISYQERPDRRLASLQQLIGK